MNYEAVSPRIIRHRADRLGDESKATMEQVNLINRINLARLVISPTFTFLPRERRGGIQKATRGESCDAQMWNSGGDLREWPRLRLTRANVSCTFSYWKIPTNGARKKR